MGVLLVAALLWAPDVVASTPETGRSGIVFGKDHAFWLTAPPGWVLDNKSGVQSGLHSVFYPLGESWRDATAVMYASTIAKNGRTTAEIVAADIARFRESSSKLVVTEAGALETEDGKAAMVRHFTGDPWGNSEAIAYIDEPKVLVMIVLSARNAESFARAQGAFRALVGSYRWITDEVRIEP